MLLTFCQFSYPKCTTLENLKGSYLAAKAI